MTPAERRQMMLAGPIVPTILALATPNVLNVAMQSLVSISDGWFVGQLGSTTALAALALVFPAQMTLGMMSAGAMGGGISSSVARALGSGNKAAAEAAAAHALVIALGMAALFAVIFVGFGRPIFGALGGSGGALDGAEAFATILFLGCIVHWVANSHGLGAARHRRHEDAGLCAGGECGAADPAHRRADPGLVRPAGARHPRAGRRGRDLLRLRRGLDADPAHRPKRATVRLRWPVDGFRWRAFRDILKVGADRLPRRRS